MNLTESAPTVLPGMEAAGPAPMRAQLLGIHDLDSEAPALDDESDVCDVPARATAFIWGTAAHAFLHSKEGSE